MTLLISVLVAMGANVALAFLAADALSPAAQRDANASGAPAFGL